jgi:hypothetical protein
MGRSDCGREGRKKQLEFLTADHAESSSHPVYIVAAGWLYVVIMMAVTEKSFLAAVVTLLCYGIAPLALLLWIVGTPQRRRRAVSRQAADEKPHQHD